MTRQQRRMLDRPLISVSSTDIRRLDGFIHYHMRAAGIPGLAIGIVEADRVAYAKGYGVGHVHRLNAVTSETRFSIGSCTKAFTAPAIALLVEEGVLSGTRPFETVTPNFGFMTRSPPSA